MAKRKRVRKRSFSKKKGASFERKVCKALSLWMSGGKRADLFWRSAMSGGRATLGLRKGERHDAQAGDVSSIDPQGSELTARFFIECRFYKNLAVGGLVFGRGCKLVSFWRDTRVAAKRHGKEAILIAKQNNQPVLMLVPLSCFVVSDLHQVVVPRLDLRVLRFDEVLKYDSTLLRPPARIRARLRETR